MPVELVIAPEAELDIAEAYIWYEGRRAGLGEEFLSSVDACMESIRRQPGMYPVVHDGSPRERQGTSRVDAGCFPYTHRPNSGTPHPVRLCALHTRCRLLQCPTRLPELSPAQRA